GLLKLNPLLRIAQRRIVTIHGTTQCTPCDAEACAAQTPKRAFQPDYLRKDVLFWNPDIVENQLSGSGGPKAPFPMCFGGAETLHSPFHDKALDAVILIFCPNHGKVCKRSVRNPHFGPVQDDIVPGIFKMCKHTRRVTAEIRL